MHRVVQWHEHDRGAEPVPLHRSGHQAGSIPPTGDEESCRIAHTELTGHRKLEAGHDHAARLLQTCPDRSSRSRRGAAPRASGNRSERAVIVKSELLAERLPALARARSPLTEA